MAERRMFAKSIVTSDAFLEMPQTARLLYFDIGMRADDEGFYGSPRSLLRLTGASEDDLRILITKGFLIPFESGVVVVKAWKINNYLQKDRIKPTTYTEEKKLLNTKENSMYTICIHSLDKISIDKNSLDKNNLSRSICMSLTDAQWDSLDSYFDNLTDLIDLIDDRLRLTNEIVSNPYAYIIKVGKNENWQTK